MFFVEARVIAHDSDLVIINSHFDEWFRLNYRFQMNREYLILLIHTNNAPFSEYLSTARFIQFPRIPIFNESLEVPNG
jgi:hypothetical protein